MFLFSPGKKEKQEERRSRLSHMLLCVMKARRKEGKKNMRLENFFRN